MKTARSSESAPNLRRSCYACEKLLEATEGIYELSVKEVGKRDDCVQQLEPMKEMHESSGQKAEEQIHWVQLANEET